MIIRAEEITKQYQHDPKKGRFSYALKKTDFQIIPGQLIIITGKSGSGKSTLLHILAGLLQPTTGKVFIDNMDLYACSDKKLSEVRNKKIGVIPQGESAIFSLTVAENISLASSLYKEEKEDKDVSILLRELGIETLAEEFPASLSGGELRRMSIARAIFQQPEIILADEPTSDLDDENTDIVIRLLKKTAQSGKAVLVVTHDTAFVPYADMRYIMNAGVLSKAPALG